MSVLRVIAMVQPAPPAEFTVACNAAEGVLAITAGLLVWLASLVRFRVHSGIASLGLLRRAKICVDQGWMVEGDRKVVWGRMDHTRTGTDAPPGPRPRPPYGAHRQAQ